MIFAILFLAARAAASCAHGTHLFPRAEDGSVPINTFGYTGLIGPLNWASLDAANTQCALGKTQSPIDMVPTVFSTLSGASLGLQISNADEGAEFENLGTTVEVVAAPGQGKMVFNNASFELQQMHFHLPSEHLDNGTSRAMEMHMVWAGTTDPTSIAVVAVYIDPVDGAHATTESPLLKTIFDSVDAITTPGSKTRTAALNMAEIVDAVAQADIQTYSGSLTTPPCSEGVRWLVSTASLGVSTETFARARDVIRFNARFPQNTPGEENILQLGKSQTTTTTNAEATQTSTETTAIAETTQTTLATLTTSSSANTETTTEAAAETTQGRPLVTVPIKGGGSIVIIGRDA